MLDSPQDKFSRRRKFDESLSEAIDATLTSMGEPVKNTVYFMLESNLNIPKNEIPNHIEDFAAFLYKTFGLGAALFEIKCIQHLHSKINVNIQQMTEDELSLSTWITEGMTFEKYVCSARNNYCNP
jgi:hypothetical protein